MEWRLDEEEEEEPGLGNRPGVLAGVVLVFNAARDEDDEIATGSVEGVVPMRCFGLRLSARGVCSDDDGDAGDRLAAAVTLRLDCVS